MLRASSNATSNCAKRAHAKDPIVSQKSMSRSCVQFLNQAILTGVASSSIRAKTLKAADLFCGAGGTSTALIEVAEAFDLACRLTGVNHWPMAIKTHQENHPGPSISARICTDRILTGFLKSSSWMCCGLAPPARHIQRLAAAVQSIKIRTGLPRGA